MPRRNLPQRRVRNALADLEGKRIIVKRRMPIGPGKYLDPGTDVTEEAKTWNTLTTHVKRDFLEIVEGDGGSAAAAPLPPPPVAEPTDEGVDALESLRSLNATASKADLRAALKFAGVEVPSGATKDELLRLRGETLNG